MTIHRVVTEQRIHTACAIPQVFKEFLPTSFGQTISERIEDRQTGYLCMEISTGAASLSQDVEEDWLALDECGGRNYSASGGESDNHPENNVALHDIVLLYGTQASKSTP